MNAHINSGSAQYYQDLFEQVLRSPFNFFKCKKTWRYASSLGRVDVLSGLMDCSPDKEFVLHAHYWACEEAKDYLECQLDAWILHENSYNGQLSENCARRI